jgi:hypothetical protein
VILRRGRKMRPVVPVLRKSALRASGSWPVRGFAGRAERTESISVGVRSAQRTGAEDGQMRRRRRARPARHHRALTVLGDLRLDMLSLQAKY